MNKFLFFGTKVNETEVLIEGDDHRHCTTVLRNSVGAQILCTDGQGHKILGTLDSIHKKHSILRINEIEKHPLPAHQLHIAIAPTKNISRIETFLEKVVEIGIQEISFIYTKNCERKSIKLDRLKKIARSAMKQSWKYHEPVLNELQSYQDFMSRDFSASANFMLHFDNVATHLAKADFKEKNLFLIGPEGDFTPQEIELSKEKGFQTMKLGEAVLRTETAGIVACTVFRMGLIS